ncbi:MAG: carbohydrate binding domain-containing protein [Fervidobacterium sp.]|uniref:carbohydrate binding domain-containing protein n=1 Tax=Fervidobacterium sp. TaxID=1871331 RepID=UPI0040495D3E
MKSIFRFLLVSIISILLFSCQFQEKVEAVASAAQQQATESAVGVSLLNNWNFRSNIKNDQANAPFEWWIWEGGKYGVGSAKVESYGVKDNYAFIKIADSGSDTWHVQFNQWVKLTPKQAYYISFRAKADKPRTINVKVLQNHDPWSNYFAKTVELTTEWKTYEFYYIHKERSDETVNFGFELGKFDPTTIYFADVIIKPIDRSEIPPEALEEEVELETFDFEVLEEEEEPDNLVNNGDFGYKIVNDQGSMPSEWWIWQAGQYGISGAKVAAYGVVDGYAFIKLEDTGFETWHLQFNQWIKVRKGHSYVITFKAKADDPRPISVKLVQTGAPYGVYFAQTVNLTTEWQTFQFEYTHPDDGDPVVTFSIELGKEKPTTVYFDDVGVLPKK